MSKKLLIIDSNALIHRAYHALPPLTTKDGTLTNAVYGYAATIISAMENVDPDYIAATFDLAKPTFRHKKYDQYKATREKAPEELYAQIPLVREFLKAYNIPIFEKEGYEADDLIGSIASKIKQEDGIEVFIVTGDLDTLQLVDNNHVKIMTLGKGINEPVIYDREKVEERFGLKPEQMIDYKALRGDPSDNIPGVRGVGDKTAVELLIKYHTLEEVYKNLDNISSKSVKNKLAVDKENAFLSYDLAKIRKNIPIEFNLEKCRKNDYNFQDLKRYMLKMEFSSLLRRISPNAQQDNLVPGEVEFIDNKKKEEKLFKKIKETGEAAIDFRFNSTEVVGAGVFLPKSEKCFYLKDIQGEELKGILRDKNIFKAGYDLKKCRSLFFTGDNTENFFENFFDIKIAAYLLRSGTGNELEKLILEEFGEEIKNKTTKKGQSSLLADTSENEEKEVAERAGWIFGLFQRYREALKEISSEQKKDNLKGNLGKLMRELENPLVEVLARMEYWGIKTDKSKLKEASQKAQEKISKLEKEIFELAGEEFNINSPSQLARILYDKLGIPTKEIKKGKTGFSTDADQLRKIRHLSPIISKIENYREFFKLKTTYADALPNLIKKGRIHTNFNQAITATGRLSSSDPNLQNIPKKGEFAKLIRSAFQAERGYKLVAIDYSQIDLRVAAHVSQDPKLIEIFREGRDVHRATAAWVNGIPEDEVSDVQRSEAKSLNFGVLYGMGTYGFMRDSGVGKERAEFFIDQYMKSFAGLKDYLDKIKQFARKNGYVETELGRRRYVSSINSSNFQLKNAAERMAINLPIQGLAADIMKMAMIKADHYLFDNYPQSSVKMILQIHDELIFEVEENLALEFAERMKREMEGVYELRVPLTTEYSIGKTWAEV
ncbi:MAG: DNA polymerase I [Candidatus Moraniibacteriota bacterium]